MATSHLPSLLFLLVSHCFLQVATLSHHRICLGNIPDYTKATQLVFLNNILESKAVVFAWRINTCKDKKVSPSSSFLYSLLAYLYYTTKELSTPFATRQSEKSLGS